MSWNDVLTMLPELYLTGAICVLLLFDAFAGTRYRGAMHWLSMLALLVTALLVVSAQRAIPATAFSGMYVDDTLAQILKLF